MINNEILKDLSSRISHLMPMAVGVRKDVEKSIQDVLKSAFARLNLVTREEFDAQMKVLERAEQTIAALEEKITTLEQSQRINPADAGESEMP